MVEVAVAIVVLGILLVAFLPLVVSSIELAAKNTTVAQANQLLSSKLAVERTFMEGSACVESSDPERLAAADSRFEVTREVRCDGNLATLTITVMHDSETLAAATTKVMTE